MYNKACLCATQNPVVCVCEQEKQLQSHAAMLQSFQEDLSVLQQGAQENRRVKAREVEELRQKEEYLQHEVRIHVRERGHDKPVISGMLRSRLIHRKQDRIMRLV